MHAFAVLQLLASLIAVATSQKKPVQGELFSFGEDQLANSRVGTSTMYEAMLKVDKLRLQFANVDRRALRFEVLKSEPIAHYFRVDNLTSALFLAEPMDRDDLCREYQLCCNDEKNCIMNLMVGVAQANNEIEREAFSVRIEVQDKDDNAPTFPRESYAVEIREDAAINSKFALLAARDRDTAANGIASYSLVNGNQTDTFAVYSPNVNSVFLRLLKPLDREAQERYSLLLVAVGRNSLRTGQMRVDVFVRDANDHHPVFSNRSYSANVPENFQIGVEILRVEAVDRDDGDYGRVVYDLDLCTEYQQSLFDVDPDTGSIYLKALLDYEKETSHVLRVQARDYGNHPMLAEASVTINVSDVNDCAPDIQVEAYDNTVEVFEGNDRPLPLGIALANVRDLDRSKSNNGNFSCSLNDTRFRLFSYAETGTLFKINLTVPLDREQSKVEFVAVSCVDRGTPALTSEKVLVVNVKDVNDNAPSFPQRSYDVYVHENTREVTQVFTLNATDDDDVQQLLYSLDSEGSRYFSVDESSGRLFTRPLVQFDRETTPRLSFVARVLDSAGNRRFSASTTINLHVVDMNDNDPLFQQPEYIFSKLENELGFVGVVRASDADSFADSVGHKVEFRLADSDDYSARFFDVRPSGEVHARLSLDRETHAVFNLSVLAVDFTELGQERRTATARLFVHVADANDNTPSIQWPSNQNNSLRVSFRTQRGVALARVLANDPDDGLNGRLSYSITNTVARREESPSSTDTEVPDTLLAIDERGTLRVGCDLSQSSLGEYSVTIRVSDTTHSVSAKLHVTVDDSAAQVHDFDSQWFVEDASSGVESFAASRSTRPNASSANDQTMLHLLVTLMLAIAFLALIIVCVVVVIRRARTERKIATRKTTKCTKQAKRRNDGEFENAVDKFLAKLLCVARHENDEAHSSRSCSSEKRNRRKPAEDNCAKQPRHEQCDASLSSDLLNNADRTYVTLDSPPIAGNCASHTLQRLDMFDEHADKYVDYSAALPQLAFCGSQVMCIPYPECGYSAYLPAQSAPPPPHNELVYVHKPVPMRTQSAAYCAYEDAEVNNNGVHMSSSSTSDSFRQQTSAAPSRARTLVSCSPVRDSSLTSSHSHRHLAAIVKGSYV